MGIVTGMARVVGEGAALAGMGTLCGIGLGIALAGRVKQKYDGVVERARAIPLDYDPQSDTYIESPTQPESRRNLLRSKWLNADARVRDAIRSFDARLARWAENGVVNREAVAPEDAEIVTTSAEIPDVEDTLTQWVLGDKTLALYDLQTIAQKCDYDTSVDLFWELSQLPHDERLNLVFSILAQRQWRELNPFGE